MKHGKDIDENEVLGIDVEHEYTIMDALEQAPPSAHAGLLALEAAAQGGAFGVAAGRRSPMLTGRKVA